MQSEGRILYKLPGAVGAGAREATALLNPEAEADRVRFAQVSSMHEPSASDHVVHESDAEKGTPLILATLVCNGTYVTPSHNRRCWACEYR